MSPKLIILCGLPGSGKSTFSKKLQAESNVVVFSSDKRLIQEFGQDFPSEKYDEYQEKIKKDIEKETETLLLQGKTVVLDFGFWRKSERENYIKKAKQLNAEPFIYFFKVDENTLIYRLRKRNNNPDHTSLLVTEDMLKTFSKKFEEPNDLEAPLTIIS